MKIAAVIITRNEERNIVRCLESVKFCDEIVVVDSGSSDATRTLAAKFTTKVLNRDWSNYADQRNFANQHVDSDWVLSVDADEVVSDELRDEVLSFKQRAPEGLAYTIPRKTFHFNRWIRYGGWYPNRLTRFFKRDAGEWKGDELHEYWEPHGNLGALSGHLLHYSFEDLADQVDRNNRYSSLGAEKLRKQGKRFSFFRLTVKTVSKFIETYFLKRGFLDGYPGFFISVSAAYSVFLKWAKLWELELAEKKEI